MPNKKKSTKEINKQKQEKKTKAFHFFPLPFPKEYFFVIVKICD